MYLLQHRLRHLSLYQLRFQHHFIASLNVPRLGIRNVCMLQHINLRGSTCKGAFKWITHLLSEKRGLMSVLSGFGRLLWQRQRRERLTMPPPAHRVQHGEGVRMVRNVVGLQLAYVSYKLTHSGHNGKKCVSSCMSPVKGLQIR